MAAIHKKEEARPNLQFGESTNNGLRPTGTIGSSSGSGRGKRLLAGIVLFLVLAGIGSLAVHFQNARNDPVIDGQRMSEWCWRLIEPAEDARYNGYGYPSKYRNILRDNRNVAIPNTISVVRLYNGRRGWRHAILNNLPEAVREWIKPKRERPVAARWRGILALSDLARQQPDARIARFFLESMEDRNPAVRKVAAYEAGPWVAPAEPGVMIEVLSRALRDSNAEVRRDACRRLAASVSSENQSYAQAARKLLTRLEELSTADPGPSVSSNALKALDAFRSLRPEQ